MLFKVIALLVCVRCSQSARSSGDIHGSIPAGPKTRSAGGVSAVKSDNCTPIPVPKVIRVVSLADLYVTQPGNASAGIAPSGFFIDLLDAIQQKTGIPYAFRILPGPSYGNPQPNGSWDGLMNELLTNKADLIGMRSVINKERDDVVDFLHPVHHMRVQALFNPKFGLTDKTEWGVFAPSLLSLTCAATNTSAQEVCAKIKASNLGFLSEEDGLARVMAGNFAFIGVSDFFDDEVKKHPGKIVAQNILTAYVGMAVQKNSMLRQLLNGPLLQIMENGDLQKLNRKYGIND